MSKHSQEKEFLQVVMMQQGIIHKICRLCCRDPDDRQDLFKEVLLQLWRSYGSYRQEAKLTTWMYRVGLNTAVSSLRKSHKKVATNALDEQMLQLPDLGMASEEEEARLAVLYQAIDQLNEVEKALVIGVVIGASISSGKLLEELLFQPRFLKMLIPASLMLIIGFYLLVRRGMEQLYGKHLQVIERNLQELDQFV